MAERAYIVTKGVVLRETETKEADKILTLLTADRGKISVIARGVRRKSCKYAACAQQMVYSEWTLYQKGEWYYANEGATAELFNGLRTNLEALALGCYFAELTETVTAPEVPAGALLPHLLNGLYALSALQKPPALVKPAFEIKLLCLAGYEPLADSCAYCGRPDPEQPLLDVVQGILRCRSCGAKESALSMPLCPDSLAALLVPADRPGAGATLRGGGGFRGRPAGAGIPDAGILQEPPAAGRVVEIRYILYFFC